MKKLLIVLAISLMAFSMFAFTQDDLDASAIIETHATYDEVDKVIIYEVSIDDEVEQMNDDQFVALFWPWSSDRKLLEYKAGGGDTIIRCRDNGKGCKGAHKDSRVYMKAYAATH